MIVWSWLIFAFFVLPLAWLLAVEIMATCRSRGHRRKFQFRLKSLLMVTTLVAVVLGFASWTGFDWGLVVSIIFLCGIAAIVVVPVWLFVDSIRETFRPSSDRIPPHLRRRAPNRAPRPHVHLRSTLPRVHWRRFPMSIFGRPDDTK